MEWEMKNDESLAFQHAHQFCICDLYSMVAMASALGNEEGKFINDFPIPDEAIPYR